MLHSTHRISFTSFFFGMQSIHLRSEPMISTESGSIAAYSFAAVKRRTNKIYLA